MNNGAKVKNILYGVETKRINETISNNPKKFPKGFL